jgi:hypothetical protein
LLNDHEIRLRRAAGQGAFAQAQELLGAYCLELRQILEADPADRATAEHALELFGWLRSKITSARAHIRDQRNEAGLAARYLNVTAERASPQAHWDVLA